MKNHHCQGYCTYNPQIGSQLSFDPEKTCFIKVELKYANMHIMHCAMQVIFNFNPLSYFGTHKINNSKMVKYEDLKEDQEFIFVKFFLPVDIPLIPQTSSDQGPSSSQEVAVLK